MHSQMQLPGLLEQGAGKLRIYSGFSFTIEKEILDLSAGLVAGPKWVKESLRKYPSKKIILDNGAFPSWVRGESLSYSDQLSAVLAAAEQACVAGVLEAVIAPDIVGGGAASWRRTLRSLEPLRSYRLLLPVQEGIDIEHAVRTCQKHNAGLFIGGKTFDFKVSAAKQVAGRVYTHVGRINRDGWLWTFSRLVDAVDSTTWVRSQNWNKRRDWAQILRRYSEAV
jgi:hypothetical protein